MSDCTAVLFDLDETLIADQRATWEALVAHAADARAGLGVAPAEAEALADAVLRQARTLWHAGPAHAYAQSIGVSSWEGLWARFTGEDVGLRTLAAWAPDYRAEAWGAALAERGARDDEAARRLAETYLERRRAYCHIFPEVGATLTRLRERYRLALVTNGAPDLQREKVAMARLAPWFDAIVVSGEVGVGKPDARVFRRALDQLGAEPAQAVMVGDNILRDIEGAQRLGMRGVWVCRPEDDRSAERLATVARVRPYAEVASLAELDGVLAGE